MATAETVRAVTSHEGRALESRMRPKDSCPVWGGGAGKVPHWQLADALLYRTYGSVRGALSNGRPYRDPEGTSVRSYGGQAGKMRHHPCFTH